METYRAIWSEEVNGKVIPGVAELKLNNLPDNDVLIRVAYSSLNYKDALSATGNRGVTRNYPHTPGIDAAGIVEASSDPAIREGSSVLVTGNDLGMNTRGGFGQYIRVPAAWVVPLPNGLSLKESMMLGTAGITAAIAISKMLHNGQRPEDGPILVSGAGGGLGGISINILAKLGFRVIAASGKPEAEYFREIGAAETVDRTWVNDESGKFLLRDRWAGAIDTVGGNILATALKACKRHGNVVCCGNALSPMLETTVFPFILNGINLLGVDSATYPMQVKKELWGRLAGEWKPDKLELISREIGLDDLPEYINRILKGRIRGRVVVDMH